MFIVWGSLAGMLFYLETVYHISCFGWSGWNPIYTIFLILIWSTLGTMLVGILREKWKKVVYYFCLWFAVIWTGVQVVYLRIFKQPLLWEAAFRGGGDALTNYWREALDGIINALPILALLVLPAIVIGVLFRKKKVELPSFSKVHLIRMAVAVAAGIVGCVVTLQVGKLARLNYYEDYKDFFDPLTVGEVMGVWPMLERDTITSISRLFKGFWDGMEEQIELAYGNDDETRDENAADMADKDAEESSLSGNAVAENEMNEKEEADNIQVSDGDNLAGDVSEGDEEDNAFSQEPEIYPHQFNIDFEMLRSLADNEKQSWLADYIEGLSPTKSNEYTGIFEGYNLIYLTAEGFSSYAIREDLTPTLYRLANSGFVFENYYVPLWQTSTSDGEYINCTALIPDGQFSMRKSGANDMAYTLPRFFAEDGVTSYAYHNNSLSYYDRYLTHPNLGYDFKGCKLGELPEEEWGDKIFPMEHPKAWPASDWEMMQGTIPEYVNQDRFHVYYMTVSGHMNYNFTGNSMSKKNKDAVASLEMSENAQAYIACNIELEKAIAYLLEQLEAAGKLENTVICLSADHYPYAMTTEQYEELAGKPLSEGMDMYRNTLILWNAGMEEEPVVVDKVCGSMDIVPTLLNLFGYDYDSRMYAGRDVFSDEEGMVIFNDRSFVTDSVVYKRKEKTTTWVQDENGMDVIAEEAKEDYLSEKKQEVKERYQFSAYILQENYYQDIKQSVVE